MNRYREARIFRGYSLLTVGERTGINTDRLWRIDWDEAEPTAAEKEKLARFYALDERYFEKAETQS